MKSDLTALTQLICPSCDSGIVLKKVSNAKSVVCPNCKSQIILLGREYKVAGKSGVWVGPELTVFGIGMRGTISGEKYEVIGRVRYRESIGFAYDEWLIMNDAGGYGWLLDDRFDDMILWKPLRRGEFIQTVEPQKGKKFRLCNTWVRVSEFGIAIVDYLEGVYTWRITVGQSLKYVNGVGSDGSLYGQDYTEDEFECYKGQKLSRDEVAGAFGAMIRKIDK